MFIVVECPNWVERRARQEMNQERGALTLWSDLCASLESARASFIEHYCSRPDEVTTRSDASRYTLFRKVAPDRCQWYQEINIQVDLIFKPRDHQIDAVSRGLDRVEGHWELLIRADEKGAFLLYIDERLETDRASEMVLQNALFFDNRKPLK
jgi:hypothetical protein